MAFDIVEWASANLKLVSTCPSEKGHEEGQYECPRCGLPRLWINHDTGDWICWHDQNRGKLAGLIAWVEGISFGEARERLVENELDSWRWRPPPRKPEPPPIPELPKEFRSLDGGDHWIVPEYVEKRRLAVPVLHRFGVGFCTTGPWHDRLIFPIKGHMGQLRGFTGRAMNDRVTPRWKHASGSRASESLYGFDQVYARHREVVLVEGPTDVIRLATMDVPAVGMFGKRLTSTQIVMLKDAAMKKVVVMPDTNDEEACLVAKETSIRLSDLGMVGTLAWLPMGIDPGAAKRSEVAAALEGQGKWELRKEIEIRKWFSSVRAEEERKFRESMREMFARTEPAMREARAAIAAAKAKERGSAACGA